MAETKTFALPSGEWVQIAGAEDDYDAYNPYRFPIEVAYSDSEPSTARPFHKMVKGGSIARGELTGAVWLRWTGPGTANIAVITDYIPV